MGRSLRHTLAWMAAAGFMMVAAKAPGEVGRPERAPSLAESAAFREVKVLNNFCWELLRVERPDGVPAEMTFRLPMDRWVFIRSHAEAPAGSHEARLSVDSDPLPLVVHRRSGDLEAMRFLPAGEHTLRVRLHGVARITALVVRAVPAMQYALEGESCHIRPYGPYDWEFLKKDVLPNVNVMIHNRHITPRPQEIGAWKAMGRRWIADASAAWELFERGPDGRLHYKGTTEQAAQAIADYWTTNTLAVRHPLVDGLLIDEIVGTNVPLYDAFREAIRRLCEDPRFKGKAVDLYVAGSSPYRESSGRELVQSCIDHGGSIAVEWYLQERPTLEEAKEAIQRTFLGGIRAWEEAIPGITPHIVATLAVETAPPESGDRYPSVDFKVFMDMQMQFLATQPDFFALGGFQWYKSGYADEEVLRWSGRLYRHYCIEGNTERLTDDPYELPHLLNPDFAEGTDGWEIRPAEEGSMEVRSRKAYGVLQGRWGRGMGDTFLWTRRSAERPNVFSQEIRHLEPGRLYSLKMITADYGDLMAVRSEKKQHAVCIRIENADLLTAPRKSFQFPYSNTFSGSWTSVDPEQHGTFDAEHPFWMNYHRRIFRARGSTARLVVMDWKSEKEPGGPVGQELIYNFIQVQPYLED